MRVSGTDPHPAEIQGNPVATMSPDAAPYPVSCLQHHDIASAVDQSQRGGQPRVSSADHDNLGVRRRDHGPPGPPGIRRFTFVKLVL